MDKFLELILSGLVLPILLELWRGSRRPRGMPEPPRPGQQKELDSAQGAPAAQRSMPAPRVAPRWALIASRLFVASLVPTGLVLFAGLNVVAASLFLGAPIWYLMMRLDKSGHTSLRAARAIFDAGRVSLKIVLLLGFASLLVALVGDFLTSQ